MGKAGTPAQNARVLVEGSLRAVLRKRTYKNLLYLVVSFPLALVYGTFVGFGFVLGILLSVVVVGFAVLAVTVAGVHHIAGFERQLANALLALDLQQPDDRTTGEGPWATVRGYIDAPSTWRGLGYVSVKFWLGLVGVLLFFFLVSALQLATAPLRYPTRMEFGTVNGQPVTWTVDTFPEALLAVPVGLGLVLVVLNLSNGFAYVAERVAVALLDSPTEPADTTADTGTP